MLINALWNDFAHNQEEWRKGKERVQIAAMPQPVDHQQCADSGQRDGGYVGAHECGAEQNLGPLQQLDRQFGAAVALLGRMAEFDLVGIHQGNLGT